MPKQTIGIIGAAIAGCASAILLDRAGYDVTVFEKRGPEEMLDQGSGLVLPQNLIDQLKELNLLDKNFPAMPLKSRDFLTLDPAAQDQERKIGTVPIHASAAHWGVLYGQLAQRLPLDKVHYHKNVMQINDRGKKVDLTFDNGENCAFDFILCADGFNSLGRKKIFPGCAPKFADYICWRGTYACDDIDLETHLYGKVLYYVYEKGILLAYEIPFLSSGKKKSANITWFFYETVNQQHPLVHDNKARSNLYGDAMTAEYISYLHRLANTYLPPFARKIVTNTAQPFTQAIYDTMIPDYCMGHSALIGDAGILLRPHLGAGATKALQDAISLYQHVIENEKIEIVWKTWGKQRREAAAHLFDLSRAFGDFLVAKPPKWNELDDRTLNAMWNRIIEGFNWYQHQKIKL